MKLLLMAWGAASLLAAQQTKPATDDVGAYLTESRAPALRHQADDELIGGANSDLSAGNFAAAEAIFRKVMSLEPETTRGLAGMVAVYLAQKRPQDAVRFVEAEWRKNPDNRELLHLLVDTAFRAGEPDITIVALQSMLDRPNTPRWHADDYSALASAYERKGDLPSAIIAWRQAKTLSPSDRNITIHLASALLRDGRQAEAAEEYQAIAGATVRDPAILFTRAKQILDQSGDLDIALACAQLASSLSPADLNIREILGLIYLRKGFNDQGLTLFRDLVSQAPDEANYHFDLALVFLQHGEQASGKAELHTALQRNPSHATKRAIEDYLAIIQ